MRIKKAFCTLAFILSAIHIYANEPWINSGIAVNSQGGDKDIFLVDDVTGWLSDNSPGVFRTDDGGKNWIKLESLENSTKIKSFYFLSKNKDWAVATSFHDGAGFLPVILKTNDGGKSWTVQKLYREGGVLNSIYFIGEKHGWAGGIMSPEKESAWVLRTSDRGNNWEQCSSKFRNAGLQNISFADNQHGWAVGSMGVLYSNDGGQTWEKQFPQDNLVNAYGLSVIDKNSAWATVGSRIHKTIDGSRHWVEVDLPKEAQDVFIYGIYFTDDKNGWIYGDRGV